MRSRRWMIGCVGLLLLALSVPLAAQPAAASTPPAEDGPARDVIESDPIRCWWRSDRVAVRVGELFEVVLTCSVIETSRIRVVPKLASLEPLAVALLPFEVIGGETHEPFDATPWRYFQFEYVLRLLSDGFFGQDVQIPPLEVTYNIQSTEGEGVEGRDQPYLLPPLEVRVLSLVPVDTADIREPPTETFGDIEARLFRASWLLVVAVLLFAFAAVLLALAAARAMRRYRVRVPIVRTLPTRSVIGHCRAEVAAIKAARERDGWSAALVKRAVAVSRIAAAIALQRPVAQQVVDDLALEHSGQLAMTGGLVHRRRVLASASTTVADLLRGVGADSDRTAIVSTIQESLAAFNAVRYSRSGDVDELAMDEALQPLSAVLQRLRMANLWPWQRPTTSSPVRSTLRGIA